MSKKYVSQLFDASKLKSNRLNVIYAPMGSGKTFLFKDLLSKHKCLMVAPYRSSRDDFGLRYHFSKVKGGLDYEFLYTSDLIDAVTRDWVNVVDLTNDKDIETTTIDYVNNLPSVAFTHILFDEVDFMWIQASMSWIGNSSLKVSGGRIWEYILKALATRFVLIGQTSTRIPTLKILNIGGQVLASAYTSVRFDSITPVLVHKDVSHNKLFMMAMDRAMKETEQRPTLVYKRKFSSSDIIHMNEMVKLGKRVLVVLREENSPKEKAPSQLLTNVLTQIGAVEAQSSGITLQAAHVHFKIIGQDTGLDQITPSADPYMFFDYLFINTSSSRQVSLKAVCGDVDLKVKVISIDNGLNSTSHQVAGRFRENRVDITHYLKGYSKTDIPSFSEMELWEKLLEIDLLISSYMKHGGVVSPDGSLSGLAKNMQYKRQAEWIAKTVKGKANQKQTHRLGVFNSWFNTESNLNQTQIKLLASYQSYCKSLGEKPFSKNVFASKLKEAKS